MDGKKKQNKYLGPVSTILRLITHKDGDLETCLDKIDETEGLHNSSLKHMLIDSPNNDDNNNIKK